MFGIEPNSDVIFDALQRQLANARAGTACTKTRSEVSGGGRKPWRQKGTGRARSGSIRSPLWAGGGVSFGPRPRDYTLSMPKKMRRLALKSALAARKESMVVVKDFSELKEPKTREMVAALKSLKLDGKTVLLVMDFVCDTCSMAERAARNIEGVKVVNLNDLSVKDLLHYQAVLTTESTIEAINQRFSGEPAARPLKARAEKPAARAAKAAPAAKAPKAKAEAKPTGEPVGAGHAPPAGKAKKAVETESPAAEAKRKAPKKAGEAPGTEGADGAEPEKEARTKAPRKKAE